MEIYSLNEIEGMGKRAAKGAGLHWGLAEEAGKATRWLAQRGLPGPELLAVSLSQVDGVKYEDLIPQSVDNLWRAKSGNLCPLMTGSILCDFANQFAHRSNVVFGSIAYPLLLAPYVAAVSKLTGMSQQLSWEGVTISFSPDAVLFEGDLENLMSMRATSAICQNTKQSKWTKMEHKKGRAVPSEIWTKLNAFAYRTYAPATEASRLSGAGAGVSDND